MTDVEIANLSDLDLIKEYLKLRGPYGEIPSWYTGSEKLAKEALSLSLHKEIKGRKLKIPSQQSIGRRAGTALTPEELEVWEELVAEWDGVSPAPKGDDARLSLQEH